MAHRGRGRYRRNNMSDMGDSYTQPAYTTPPSNLRSHMQQQQHLHQQRMENSAIKQEYHQPPVKLEPQVQEAPQPTPPPTPSRPQEVVPPPVQQVAQPSEPKQAAPAQDSAMETQENGDDKKPWKKKYSEDEITFSSDSYPPKEQGRWGYFSNLSNKPRSSVYAKIPKKVRKKRLNAKLRNILAPKNAMMVLQELHQDLVCAINEEMTPTGQLSYTVTIEIEGKQYKGQGLSKAAAKQTACENALKAAILDKMTQSTMKNEMEVDQTPVTENEGTEGGENPPKPPRKIPEDDVPWGSLASYAVFKLFSEWQAQGYMLPTNPAQAKPFAVGQTTGTLQPMKKIPPDANQKHPVQLLNQLKPLCQYTDSRQGNPPNMVFTFNVAFDNQTFTGTGPNKKEAKKACAKAALISLGIDYDQ